MLPNNNSVILERLIRSAISEKRSEGRRFRLKSFLQLVQRNFSGEEPKRWQSLTTTEAYMVSVAFTLLYPDRTKVKCLPGERNRLHYNDTRRN